MAVDKKNSGFSLIELLVVTALMGLLSVALVSVFLATVRGSNRARLEAEIRAQGDAITTTLERNLRQAVRWTCTLNSITYITATDNTDGLSFTFSDNTIRFADLPDVGNQLVSNNVSLDNGSVVIECGESGGGYSQYVVAEFDLVARRAGDTVREHFTARVAMRNKNTN